MHFITILSKIIDLNYKQITWMFLTSHKLVVASNATNNNIVAFLCLQCFINESLLDC